MSIGRLRDGRVYVQYLVDGRTKREYFGRGASAEAAAAARQSELGLRKWTSSRRAGGISFGELAQLYMDAGAARMRDSTIDRLLRRLDTSILPQIGHHAAGAITPAIMDAYVLHRRREGCSGSTCRAECAVVKTILRWGKKRHHIEFNPLDDFDLPKISTVPIPPPTIDEILRIYRVAPPHTKRAVALLWFLGLRGAGSELLGLRWDAVDWENQTIQIASARKGGPVSRRIRLHPALFELMRQWASEDDCPYIVHWRGKRCRDIRYTWRRSCDRAKVRRIRPYDCRHAFATNILTRGGDIRTVQTLIGHATPALTWQTYTHATKSAAEAAVGLIPGTGFEVLPDDSNIK